MLTPYLKDLRHPRSQQRRQAIIHLAQAGSLSAIPALQTLQAKDPDPALRQLAQRAIAHLQKQASDSESAEAALRPGSHPEAEAALLRAEALFTAGDWYDALALVRHALTLAPSLARDPQLQDLVERISGRPGQPTLALLQEADGLQDLLRLISRRQHHSMPLRVPGVFIILTLIILYLMAVLLLQASGIFLPA